MGKELNPGLFRQETIYLPLSYKSFKKNHIRQCSSIFFTCEGKGLFPSKYLILRFVIILSWIFIFLSWFVLYLTSGIRPMSQKSANFLSDLVSSMNSVNTAEIANQVKWDMRTLDQENEFKNTRVAMNSWRHASGINLICQLDYCMWVQLHNTLPIHKIIIGTKFEHPNGHRFWFR